MSSKKYLYRRQDDVTLSSPWFDISPDVELKDHPTNGEEYLLKVINERQNILSVTRCNKDISKFAKNQSFFAVEVPKASVAEQLKPSIEWQNIQVADFSDIRLSVSRMIAKESHVHNLKRISLNVFSKENWKELFIVNEPTLTHAVQIMNSCKFANDVGLEMLTEIIGETKPGDSIDYVTGQWIYAFLVMTKLPLLSDTACILRNLARKCAEIRSYINPEKENSLELAAPLNLFICLIGRYFGQNDLADERTFRQKF